MPGIHPAGRGHVRDHVQAAGPAARAVSSVVLGRMLHRVPGMTAARHGLVNAQHISLATVTSSSAAESRDPELALAELMRDVRDVIRHLEAAGEPMHGAVARCNAAIEHCLESRRDRDRDVTPAGAKDELKRLSALLTKVDPAEVPMVMRQIRRVLGRFDESV